MVLFLGDIRLKRASQHLSRKWHEFLCSEKILRIGWLGTSKQDEVHRDCAPALKRVYFWTNESKRGHTSAQDGACAGRPVEVTPLDIVVQRIHGIVTQNPWITVHECRYCRHFSSKNAQIPTWRTADEKVCTMGVTIVDCGPKEHTRGCFHAASSNA